MNQLNNRTAQWQCMTTLIEIDSRDIDDSFSFPFTFLSSFNGGTEEKVIVIVASERMVSRRTQFKCDHAQLPVTGRLQR